MVGNSSLIDRFYRVNVGRYGPYLARTECYNYSAGTVIVVSRLICWYSQLSFVSHSGVLWNNG